MKSVVYQLLAGLPPARARVAESAAIAAGAGGHNARVRLERIDAISDARLDDSRGVIDPDWLERRRLFVAEGRHAAALLIGHAALRTRSALVTPTALHALAQDLEKASPGLPVYVVEPALLRELGGVRFHQGCLALGERPQEPDLAQAVARLAPGPGLVVVLEGLSDPDNVGSVFRSAHAFGADLVALGPRCSHPLYRKSIRTSMGATLLLPYAHAQSWPADLELLRSAGFALVALGPRAMLDIDAIGREIEPPERVALLLGTEGEGLSESGRRAADVALRSPMARGVDSLTVAAAAAIALHRLAAGVRG